MCSASMTAVISSQPQAGQTGQATAQVQAAHLLSHVALDLSQSQMDFQASATLGPGMGRCQEEDCYNCAITLAPWQLQVQRCY